MKILTDGGEWVEVPPELDASAIADRWAHSILAMCAEADPDDVRQIGQTLAAQESGTLRGIGLALSVGGAYADLYAESYGEDQRPRYRELTLANTISHARFSPETDALAEQLLLSGDALWTAVGQALREVREAWRAGGGQ